MKRWIAGVLAAVMLVCMLAGCGAQQSNETEEPKQTETTPKQTEPPKQTDPAQPTVPAAPTEPSVSGGETENGLLNAPEAIFDAENTKQLYLCFTVSGDTAQQATEMEIALQELNDEDFILYVTDGTLRMNEIVYEVVGGNITKYTRELFSEGFTVDTSASPDEQMMEALTFAGYLATFMLATLPESGVQFRKADSTIPTISFVGDVYTYEILENGQVTGVMSIHKETGLMVNMRDADGNNLFTVTALSVTDAGIPAYK